MPWCIFETLAFVVCSYFSTKEEEETINPVLCGAPLDKLS